MRGPLPRAGGQDSRMRARREGLSVRHSLAWGAVGSLGYGLSQWLLVVLLARTGSAMLVGEFSLALAISAPLQMIANMQLANLFATDAENHHTYSTYITARWLSVAVMGATICCIAVSLQNTDDRITLLLVGASKAVEALSDIRYGLFLKHHRMDIVARSQLLRAMGGTMAFYVALQYGGGLPWALTALTVAWLCVLILHDRPNGISQERGQAEAPQRGSTVGILVRQALPLGVVAALISVNVSFPRLVLESHFGKGPLGVFAAMASLVVAGRLLLLPLIRTLTPRLANCLARRDLQSFWSILRYGLAGSSILGAGGIVLAAAGGASVLRLLFGVEFSVEPRGFLVLMVAASLGYLSTIIQGAATAARVIRPQVAVLVAALLSTIALATYLIPSRGVLGACMAVAGGSLVELLASIGLLWWSTAQLQWDLSPENGA